ncbi:unnamed protein product [Fusarium equiseti]|uniref:2EXR domain-containing protein n=1 Tax=Fusarium equiseti TaxID=61235 RepID=A0A8J2N8U6_FUSEQ|nr:unnamed protein product [Fusarium equiseti]
MDNTPPRRNLHTQSLSPPCPSKRILFLERADSPLQQALQQALRLSSACEQQAGRSQQTNASHQRASASQQQDDELQSFHSFSDLPLELQDKIWEHALDISAPTAHYIHVELESDGYWKMRALKVKSECDDCSSSRKRPSIEAIYPVRQALMQTCRRSYGFVRDASKFWVRDSSGTPLLEIGLSWRVWTECDCTPPSTRSTTPDLSDAQLSALLNTVYLEDLLSRAGPPMPELDSNVTSTDNGDLLPKPLKKRVDTSNDLMICFHSVRNIFDTRTVYPDFKRGMGTNAKQVAIPYHSSGLSHCRISLACMLGVLNELRTLYLLIDPCQVRSLPVPVNPMIRIGRPDPGYGYGEGNNPRHRELEESSKEQKNPRRYFSKDVSFPQSDLL